jgi:hypothetical protein
MNVRSFSKKWIVGVSRTITSLYDWSIHLKEFSKQFRLLKSNALIESLTVGALLLKATRF